MDTGLLMAGELRTRTVNRAAFYMALNDNFPLAIRVMNLP